MNKPKVLFILDKWCFGNKTYGISEWETSIWKSLESTDLAEVTTFHFDDRVIGARTPVDSELIALCTRDKPDFICIILYRLPGSHNTVPTYNTLSILARRMNIPIMAIWGDIQGPTRNVEALLPYTKLNIHTAQYSGADKMSNSKTFYYSWVPKDERMFYDYKIERNIPILYIGSTRPERTSAITCIKNAAIDILCTGGERNEHIVTSEYATLLNRTKINLSFSYSGNPGVNVVNARVFETMLCGAMLLEQNGQEIHCFYDPFEDYVPFGPFSDLVDKVKYYLEHAEERLAIAKHGHDKTVERYNAKLFWECVIERLL